MKLYQLLMLVHSGCSIIIFDSMGIQIFKCRDKDSVPIELNEYEVLEFTAGWINVTTRESGLYITLQK